MDELMDQLGMSKAALAEWDALWYAYLTGRMGCQKETRVHRHEPGRDIQAQLGRDR